MVADYPNAQTGSDRAGDRVRLHLDWVPATQAGRATFSLRIERAGQQSALEFEIDLLKLGATELKRLQDFLERRHAGLTGSAEVIATSSWLLDCSLGQTQTSLKGHERQAMVRALLLVPGDTVHQTS
jgi:hypothetical protein